MDEKKAKFFAYLDRLGPQTVRDHVANKTLSTSGKDGKWIGEWQSLRAQKERRRKEASKAESLALTRESIQTSKTSNKIKMASIAVTMVIAVIGWYLLK
ncbi:MAG: hypothetical protein V3R64_07620 [Sphingomonadales bacterium]